MFDVAVIEDPTAAEVSLDPVRARLLAELVEPGSATMLATKVGLPRQKVNYHLKAPRAGSSRSRPGWCEMWARSSPVRRRLASGSRRSR